MFNTKVHNLTKLISWKKTTFAFSLEGLRGFDKPTLLTQDHSHCLSVYIHNIMY